MAYLDGRQPSSSSHNTFQGQGSLEGGGGGEQEERRETIPVEVHQIRCAEDGDEQVWVKLLYRLVSLSLSFRLWTRWREKKKEFPFLFFFFRVDVFSPFLPFTRTSAGKAAKRGERVRGDNVDNVDGVDGVGSFGRLRAD